jgi:RNA polymerase sigma-70 factor (ECF subfamily)
VARQARRPAWVDIEAHQPVDGESPEVIVEQRDREATVRAAVATLPDDQRQAVLLRFGGDLRNREIGEIMGRSEGAVKLLTFRAMTALRKELGAPLPAERSMEGRQ